LVDTNLDSEEEYFDKIPDEKDIEEKDIEEKDILKSH